MPDISVCMIVRDEARSLARCLQSVQGAEQIVVMDTGSVDDTVAIARSFGVELGHQAWQADFAGARNASLERARCDWILVIDADETLPPGGLDILRAESQGPHEGYILPVDCVALVKGERISSTAMVLRFFRNRPEYRFKGRVHEQISEALLACGGSIGRSRVRVFHDGYDPVVTASKGKKERNLALLAAMVRDDPSNPYQRYKLGNALAGLGRTAEARVELEAALAAIDSAGNAGVFPYHHDVFVSLARVLGQGGDCEAAREMLHRAAAKLPRTPEILYELGSWQALSGDADEAINHLTAALEIAEEEGLLANERIEVGYQAGLLAGDLLARRGQHDELIDMYTRAARFASRWPVEVSPVVPWLKIAVAQLQADKPAEALLAYQEVVRRQPDNLPALLGLGTLYFGWGMHEQAKVCFEAALAIKPEDPELSALLVFCQQRISP